MFFLLNVEEKYTLIIIACLLVLLFIVIGIYIYLLSRNRIKKIAKDFEIKVADLNDIATNQFDLQLNRLKVIAENNEDYHVLYEKYRLTREGIISKYRIKLDELVFEIHNLSLQNKNKLIKEKIRKATELYRMYFNEISELDADIQLYLNKNDECHEKSVPYKRRYRDIKQKYNNNMQALSFSSESFGDVFEKIELIFEEFDALCNCADYSKAEEKIASLDKVLLALNSALDNMPKLCAKIEMVIPDKINELKQTYQQLIDENYPLHHLKFTSTIEEIEELIERLKQKLIKFSYKNIEQDIESISEELLYIEKSFEDEKKAKLEFDSNIDQAYKNAGDLEKRFTKIKRSLPEYKEVYCIKEIYIDNVANLQDKITELAKTRRELETYMHVSSRQPYSILINILQDLIKQCEYIDQTLLDFQNYLKSLKTDSEHAYSKLHDSFVQFKDLEYKLSLMNIKSYKESLKPSFIQAYKLLDNVGEVINIRPINVEVLNDAVKKITEIENNLTEDINNRFVKMTEAEDAVVMANKYRLEFHDAKQSLLKAEEYFFNFAFIETLQEAVSTIKNMDPNIGK